MNRKITVFTFTVMFLIYGIMSFGYTDETDSAHFHEESTTRSVTLPAVVGTNVGAPVQAHSVGTHDRYRFRDRNNRFSLNPWTGQLTIKASFDHIDEADTMTINVLRQEIEAVGEHFRIVSETQMDSIEVIIEEAQSEVAAADALPAVSSEERARIAAALAMDRVIFNELRNATTDTHDWIELRNITNADVTLDDWQVHIATDAGTRIVTFPAGTVLPAGGLLLFLNTDPDAPEMPLSTPEGAAYPYIVDAGLILPQTNFTLLLRSATSWEDSVGNFFFGFEIPPTAPPLTMDAAWYRARPDVLGYQSEAWVMSGYQDGIGYDVGVPAAIALGTPGHPQSSLRMR
jgi:hypothetical protein